MSKPRIRLLLVDDHFFVRMGLTSSLNAEPDLRVVAEADNGLQAIEQFRAHRPDVVILDGRKPRGRRWSAGRPQGTTSSRASTCPATAATPPRSSR